MATIAFYGVGTMGLPIVKNLLKGGHTVYVYDRYPQGPKAAEECGAIIANSAAEAAKNADFIMSIVNDDNCVKDIFLKEDLRDAVKPGSIIIEMSSISPGCMREVEEFYKPVGVSVIDSPVTGGIKGAIDGALTMLAAGDPEDFKRAEPVYASIAKAVYNFGKVGNGKLVKAVTNLQGAINLAAAAECMRFLKTQDVNLDELEKALPACAAGSNLGIRNFRAMVEDKFTPPTFRLNLMRKDMGLALDEMKEAYTPLSDVAYELFKKAAPYDLEDYSAIIKVDK